MTTVLISCPVYNRAWILKDWFDCIASQNFPLSDIGFQFEAGPHDEPTIEALLAFSNAHPELRSFDININTKENHKSHPENGRLWTREHYGVMARMRNILLNRAVCLNPDRYFSLDTDILLEREDTISELVELTETRPAVSPLMFMTPQGIDFPSVMTFNRSGQAYRSNDYPMGTLFKADVIMAAVMMNKSVYTKIRYDWHPQGEDLGFALQMSTHQLDMYCASNIYCPHIMSRSELEIYKNAGDKRLDLLKRKYPLTI